MRGTYSTKTEAMVRRHHEQSAGTGQCSGRLTQAVAAPAGLVWSLVREFSCPQAYKRFVKSCVMRSGDGCIPGSIREVRLVSGLPAAHSVERLDRLDDEARLLSFSIIGGDHRLLNYCSTTTVQEDEGGGGSLVIESYVVDVPAGSTGEDTCAFANTIIRCNLTALANTAEKLTAVHSSTRHI